MITDSLSLTPALTVFTLVGMLACFDLVRRFHWHRPTHLLFACLFGSLLSLALIGCVQRFLDPTLVDNSYLMAFGIILLAIGWKILFGGFETDTRVVMLGTFIAWVTLFMLLDEPTERRWLYLLAALTALVPTVIWCTLFLRYHRERLSSVLLLFFGGMLSTVPILFYDVLVRRGIEMQFFVFRIVPESFNQTSQSFVDGMLGGIPVDAGVLGALLAYGFVGLIEEGSKAWVVRKSGVPLATSIDDVMQFAVITAVGFAFAENIVNPSYFVRFVQDTLITPSVPDLAAFFGNAAGRSVLTSMVHIVSTGVFGYFLGLATFAPSYLAETERGHRFRLWQLAERLTGIDRVALFRVASVSFGLVAATLLHAAFNFLVTLPDLLPGHPETLGDLLGSGLGVLGAIPLLLIPSLLYVVGGFWLLTGLFLRRENQEERSPVSARLPLGGI